MSYRMPFGEVLLRKVGGIDQTIRALNKIAVKIGAEVPAAHVAAYFDGPLPRQHTRPLAPISLACVSVHGIFADGHLAVIARAIFDAPVAEIAGQQCGSIRQVSRNAHNRIVQFAFFLAPHLSPALNATGPGLRQASRNVRPTASKLPCDVVRDGRALCPAFQQFQSHFVLVGFAGDFPLTQDESAKSRGEI